MDAIVVENVSKRFRVLTIPKQASLKQAIVGLKVLDLAKRKTLFVEAINDVSFRVQTGTTLGIIGKNGSGKSTLLRLLAGIYTPNQGSIRVRGEIAPLLSLGIGFHPEMTGRENVKLYGLVLGLTPREIESKFEEIVEFAELRDFIDAPVKVYSSGMYMRLAFAVAVSVNPDILLLDEVLAVGDEAFGAKCYARIREFKKQGKTIVLVTHSTATLLDFCDSALWIDEGSIRLYGLCDHVAEAYHQAMQAQAIAG
ncbi:MAG TPA: ABC transporter ATP-binding protein [Candidatus Baltobacteraceae bacterium]|nr:ABC transporter ATP-binding protein [Candidatus Baltobacteraceae bacterium]